MPYLNSWRRALVAMALLLAAVPGLRAQETSSVVSAPIRGDVDGDGRVTRADAEAVRTYLVRGTLPAGRSILPAGDANGDGRVTAADAALISRFAAGQDVSRFPVGRPVDGGRGGSGDGGGAGALQTGDQFCEADLEAGRVTCREVLSAGMASQNVILGTPFVTFLTTSAFSDDNLGEDTTIYTVAIRNDIPQPLGTTDTTTLAPAPGGIRLFFTDGPRVTKFTGAQPRSIRLETPDDTATFTNQDATQTYVDKMYFQYDEVLAPGDTSEVVTMRFIYSANVVKFVYSYRVSAPAPFEHGWVTVAPETPPVIGPTQTTTLTATVYNQVGVVQADGINWSTSDPAVATVDGSGVVTGVGGGTATITATSAVNAQRMGSRDVQVIEAMDKDFETTVLGNVAIDSAPFEVTEGDVLHGATVTVVTDGTTQQGGTVDIDADGTFTYDPPAGYEGPDSFDYTIQTGTATSTATVSLEVGGMIWFVDADAAAECTTHCGRLSSPYKALATFNTANQAGGGSDPADNEPVFLYEGTAYTGPVALRAGQGLIGQDATGDLATLAGVTVPGGSATVFPSTNSGNADKVTIQGSDGVNLAQNNSIYGFTVATTGNEAISGSNFGTLTLASGPSADVTIASSGQALALNTGTLSGAFASVSSTAGTNNVSLVGVGTSGTASLGGGALSGASGDAFVLSNGTGSFSYTGTITNTLARAVNVSGKTGGTVTLSGAINPGVVGAAGGVSLTTNTGATIVLSGGMTVSTATTVPFTATGGGTVEVTGTNTLAVTGAAPGAVNLSGITVGAAGMSFSSISSTGVTTGSAFSATSVTGGSFTAGSLSVTGTTGGTSRGIALTTNSTPFTFTTASVNGTGAEGIFLSGNTGAVTVSGGSVGTTAGDALSVSGGNAGVTVNANLAKVSAGRIANIASRTGGAVTVGGSLTCNTLCTGILANANAGTIDFTSGTKTLNTGASAAVTLTNNTGTIGFTNGGLVIQTTSGAGFSASGGGTVNVEGTTNSVNSTSGGTAVSINGTTIGANGVRFVSVSANGAANGIFLNSTGASGGSFRVDGTGTVGSGGSILNTSGGDGATSGNGVYLNNVRNVILSGMIINDHPNHGIFGQTVHGFTLDNSRLAGTHGSNVGFDEAVISITGLNGQAVFSNDSISGGIEDNVRILNHGIVSAATDSILFNNVRMGHVNNTSGNTALLVRVADGSTNRVRIRNSTFHGSRGGAMLHLNVVNTATARLALDANTFNNTQTQISGAGGVLITASGTAASVPTLTYNITGNTFRGSRTVALNINKDVGLAVINGNISGNTIGVAATANSGSVDGSGIQLRHQGGGTHRATVTNNQIFQYNNYGIILEAGDAVAGGGHGRMDMTVTGNTISNPGTLAFPWNGLHANIGTVTDDAHILCLAATGNSLDNSGTATQDIRLRQRMKTTILLPGYGGSSSDNTAVNNFVKANNGNGVNLTVVASNSVGVGAPNGPGNGFTNGSCNAPTL